MNEEKKPKWLRALEAQSWQAELIASGLAIYGSISMGAYIDDLVEWIVISFDDRILKIAYFLMIYVYTVHALLVISFITHLILRILWAGILGLSSVFPGGINMDTKAYPIHFKEELKKEFPNLSHYSLELDKLCSLIFSILCALVIVLISSSIWILLYLIISELLLKFLPISVVNAMGYVLLGIVMLFSIVSGLLIQGKFKESQFSKKYAYKFNRIFGKTVYLFGYKAFSYITQTIRTNVTSKLFFVGMFAILFISMITVIPRIDKMVYYMLPDRFVEFNTHASYAVQNNYLDKFESNLLLEPTIQSEVIKDNFIQLYLPIYKRENSSIFGKCGKFIWNDSLSNEKNRELRNNFKVNCANNYYKIHLDTNHLKNLDFQYRRRLYNNREGFEVFILLDSINKGNHVLTLETAYKSDEGIPYKRSIPFYKASNN